MRKKVAALFGAHVGEGLGDGVTKRLLGARLGAAQGGFDLGPHQLDGIQIRAVGRQISETCTGLREHLCDEGGFVRGEVVHDHDGARGKFGNEHLLHVGFE